MKALKCCLILLILLLASTKLVASGGVGIYAIIEKVVLEPNERTPERVQIWGAFTLVESGTGATLTPQRGYMYFGFPPVSAATQRDVALKEWADFKAIAGTGQAVAFGQIGYIGLFTDELISRPAGNPPYLLVYNNAKNPIRPESASPSSPDPYLTNFGLTKLSSTGNLAAVIDKLKAALKR